MNIHNLLDSKVTKGVGYFQCSISANLTPIIYPNEQGLFLKTPLLMSLHCRCVEGLLLNSTDLSLHRVTESGR